MTTQYMIDPYRVVDNNLVKAGIAVKAKRFDGYMETVDIVYLDKQSIVEFLNNEGSTKVALHLLHHFH